MAKNSKRRRNGKLKRKDIQIIKLNTTKTIVTKKAISKVIFVQPTKGRPERNEFGLTKEGKKLFKEARKAYYTSTPVIEKKIERTPKKVVFVIKKELIDLIKDEKRAAEIKLRYDAYLEYCTSRGKKNKGKSNKIHDFESMVSSIRLLKSKHVKRIIDPNLSQAKKDAIVFKLKQKLG